MVWASCRARSHEALLGTLSPSLRATQPAVPAPLSLSTESHPDEGVREEKRCPFKLLKDFLQQTRSRDAYKHRHPCCQSTGLTS